MISVDVIERQMNKKKIEWKKSDQKFVQWNANSSKLFHFNGLKALFATASATMVSSDAAASYEVVSFVLHSRYSTSQHTHSGPSLNECGCGFIAINLSTASFYLSSPFVDSSILINQMKMKIKRMRLSYTNRKKMAASKFRTPTERKKKQLIQGNENSLS